MIAYVLIVTSIKILMCRRFPSVKTHRLRRTPLANDDRAVAQDVHLVSVNSIIFPSNDRKIILIILILLIEIYQ